MTSKKAAALKQSFTAVAAYDLDGGKMPGLVNYKSVLGALSGPKKDTLNLGRLYDQIEGISSYSAAEMRALGLLTGLHESGLRIALVAVADDKGKKAIMPVLFDKLQDTALAVGPGNLSATMGKQLKKSGISYVDKSEADAGAKANEFVVKAARHRGEINLIGPGDVEQLVMDFATALSGAGAFQTNPDGTNKPLPGGTTAGDLLVESANSGSEPAVFVAAAKKPPSPKR